MDRSFRVRRNDEFGLRIDQQRDSGEANETDFQNCSSDRAGGRCPGRGRRGPDHQDRRQRAADRRVRRFRHLCRQRRQDRCRRDQRQGRRARQEDRTRHRGQQEQSDGSRRRRRKADHQRQGAGHDGCMGLEPDAGRDAQADGIRSADGGRDLLVRQDHHDRQSLHLPHLAAIGDRGRGVQGHRRQARTEEGRFPRHQQRLGPRHRRRLQQDDQGEGHHGRVSSRPWTRAPRT